MLPGSVVNKNVPSDSIVGGIPINKLKSLEERVEKLEKIIKKKLNIEI